MKHVFLIHSNITYLAALGTICKEKLIDDDVLIISRYKLGDDLPIKAHYIDFIRNYKKPWKSKWMYNPIGYIDDFLKKQIGNEHFIAYLEAMVLHAKVLVSNEKCKSYNFIEEGSSAHYKSVPMNMISYDDISEYKCPLRYNSFRRRIIDVMTVLSGISLKNYSLPYAPQCYYFADGVKFYGFGNDSFRFARQRVQLSWSEIAKRFIFEKKYQLANSCIWIGIPAQLMSYFTLDNYREGIEKRCIPHLKQHNIRKTYLKHHPVCSKDYREIEVDVFLENGIEVEIIPDEVCLEMELLGEKNISIYTVMSSVVEYALQMGINKCYSIAQHFPGYIEEDGTDIWDKVKLL